IAGTEISYDPDPGYCNEPAPAPDETFNYEITDGHGASDQARVSVRVICATTTPPVITTKPLARDDARTVVEDSAPTTFDLLANDTDPEGDPLQITDATDPQYGSVLIVDGSPDQVRYTPDPNYCNDPGPAPVDSFSYTISDPGGATDSADVAITVSCVNDGPLAVDDARTVAEDSGPSDFDVLSNDTDPDGDPLQISAGSVSDPANGTATLVVGSPDQVQYTPDPNYCNDPDPAPTDDFDYTISDGFGGTDTATVSVTVSCVPDAPVARDDSYAIPGGGTFIHEAIDLPVLANDTDADGDPIEIIAISTPSQGTAEILQGNPDKITYNGPPSTGNPSTEYCTSGNPFGPNSPPVTFTYTITGGATATVTVAINCGSEG
ncbi:MAG: cadherin-like domain-containing protein, partial [Solirubrobacterales bacterium]